MSYLTKPKVETVLEIEMALDSFADGSTADIVEQHIDVTDSDGEADSAGDDVWPHQAQTSK